MKNNLKKNFIWNLIGSTFNSFTSLFFLIIVTRLNGIDDAGIFTFAFSNACLLQVVGIYINRAYQVTESDKKISDSDYIHTKIITILMMFIIGLVFSIIRNYDFYKISIIMLLIFYKALDAFSESIYAIMQKKDFLYKVGISLFIKGIVGTIVFIVADVLTKDVILSLWCLIISNILLILFYDFRIVKKLKFKLEKIKIKNSILLIRLGFWTFLFTLLTQYLINASKYAIDSSLSNDIQTIYGIIAMPASILVLIANFIIHPFLNGIKKTIDDKNYSGLNKTLLKMSLSIIIVTGVSVILCYFVGIPILNLMYNIKLDNYLTELLIILTGSGVFGITIIISNIMIAMRKTMSQTVIFGITSLFALFMSKFLVEKYLLLGAAWSYLLSMSLLFVLYVIVYIYILKKEKHYEK